MKALITSGGTSVMIDDMRCITSYALERPIEDSLEYISNLSNGRLGRDIANVCIEKGTDRYSEVCLLRSRNAMKVERPILPYRDETYFTFDEYRDKLEKLCKEIKPEIIILSAAVSDYGVDKKDGKIDSSGSLTLEFKPLPKVISMVRGWCPDAVICGFKMMAGVDTCVLIARAQESIKKNDIDLVVANDWSTIKDRDHKKFIVRENAHYLCDRVRRNHPYDIVEACEGMLWRKRK